MFGFHKPKMYRSTDGCCICGAKSSSSRFTGSERYELDFKSCFGLGKVRCGDICNACVLLVKRWKKLPAGSNKNWNHVVDAKAGSNMKTALRPKKIKKKPRHRDIGRVPHHLKTNNSDALSTTSSASPAQSPAYSDQSEEGSDAEVSPGAAPSPVFSFLDLKYWKRQKVCCGVVYKGRYGEVIITPHLYKPCRGKEGPRQPQDKSGPVNAEPEEEQELGEEGEEESEEEEQTAGENAVTVSPAPLHTNTITQ